MLPFTAAAVPGSLPPRRFLLFVVVVERQRSAALKVVDDDVFAKAIKTVALAMIVASVKM